MKRGRPPYDDILTPREWEVLTLLREGLTNAQIAERLGITERGAKYHVTEILGKLGLNNRRDAAEWRPNTTRRHWSFGVIGAFRHWFAQPVAKVCVASLVASWIFSLFAFGAVHLPVSLSDVDLTVLLQTDSKSSPDRSAVRNSPETRSNRASQPEPPDALPILVSGQPVSFTICSRSDDWQLRTLDEMEDTFNRDRFGDGGGPWPSNFALYLADIHYIRVPFANSANAEIAAFSQVGQIRDLESSCEDSQWRQLPHQALNLAGYHILGMARQGRDLVVQVEPVPGRYEHVRFDTSYLDTMNLDSLQVIDAAGTLLHGELGGPAGPYQRTQNDAFGNPEVVVAHGWPMARLVQMAPPSTCLPTSTGLCHRPAG